MRGIIEREFMCSTRTPPTDGANPAVRGEFEEGRIYMIADGCAEAFDMKGRKIGK